MENSTDEPVEMGKVRLSIYVAGQVNSNIELDFIELIVDGKPIFPIEHSKLPVGQGVAAVVGTYVQGKEISLKWKFHTHIITAPTPVAIGVIRAPGSNRTILEKLNIEAFKDYGGTSLVVV